MNYSEIALIFQELSEKEHISLEDIEKSQNQLTRMYSLIASRLYDLSSSPQRPQTPSTRANSVEISEYARKLKDWENSKADIEVEKQRLRKLHKDLDKLSQALEDKETAILVQKLSPDKAKQVLDLTKAIILFYEEVGEPTEAELVEFLVEKLK